MSDRYKFLDSIPLNNTHYSHCEEQPRSATFIAKAASPSPGLHGEPEQPSLHERVVELQEGWTNWNTCWANVAYKTFPGSPRVSRSHPQRRS